MKTTTNICVDQFLQHRYKVEQMIVDTTLDEFEKGNLTEPQMREIADYTVNSMKNVQTPQDIHSFLVQLTGRFPIFQNLVTMEAGTMKQISDINTYSGAINLAKQGRLDDAIVLAKTATKGAVN